MPSSPAAFSPLPLVLKVSSNQTRNGEPVRCGLPWPKGQVFEPGQLQLLDFSGTPCPMQVKILNRWADGSVRWALLDWQATIKGETTYQISIQERGSTSTPTPSGIQLSSKGPEVHINTGKALFQIQPGKHFPFAKVLLKKPLNNADMPIPRLVVENEIGVPYFPVIQKVQVEDNGPLRAVVFLEGRLENTQGDFLLNIKARLHFLADSATFGVELTLHNPRAANHPGGFWSLGEGGSVYLREATVQIPFPGEEGQLQIHCSAEVDNEEIIAREKLEIYQDSSGGDNWKSTNHINRQGVVPHTFQGYQLVADGKSEKGIRATPIVWAQIGKNCLALAMRHFWQNFPKGIQADKQGLRLELFPRAFADVHEIQGGEQKTHHFWVALEKDEVTDQPLAWCREPLSPEVSPEWYCASGALPYLTPQKTDPHSTYLDLVQSALEGEDTFSKKREVIDEYGWRHFGDIYGDHEAVFDKGQQPLVSHYNNQYDPLAGFAYQYCRSGDERWWAHCEELAWHVIDIDIYHTDEDKSAYNHGLFWHTVHYVDAGKATHRTYPRAPGVPGGGPACEQNYITGLCLYYWLTGNESARIAALELAQWVIDMDDGSKTIFRWLDSGPSGLASATRTPDYHGPGRGAGNSIGVLTEAHRLSGEKKFLDKAEEIIRRTIHPADNIAARNLLDAENRWFYTMYLQCLARYLDHKAELGQLDGMYSHGKASLLHYARWMAENEYPYLEKPEILEYPTETWPAQDMRKSEVFKYAARHTTGPEKERFLERADYFFNYSTQTLASMPTRTLARPVVLLLCHGFFQDYMKKRPDSQAPKAANDIADFGSPKIFIPQKVRAKKRFILLAGVGAILFSGLVLYGVISWLGILG